MWCLCIVSKIESRNEVLKFIAIIILKKSILIHYSRLSVTIHFFIYISLKPIGLSRDIWIINDKLHHNSGQNYSVDKLYHVILYICSSGLHHKFGPN